jgi:MtrB/PioB family decaheme-associated outer membrane protein
MTQKFALRAMLLSGACLLPLSAVGADIPTHKEAPPTAESFTENEVEFGVLGLWGTNTGQYGRYNGFTMGGVDGLFSFSSLTLPTWDSSGTWYWDFSGDNINFQFGDDLGRAPYPCRTPLGGQCQTNSFSDSRHTSQTWNDIGPDASLNFAFGSQGQWGIDAWYNAISYTGNIIDSIYTINGDTAVLNGLKPWGGATNSPRKEGTPTTGFAYPNSLKIAAAEQPYQVGTRRDRVGLNGKYLWNDWTFRFAVSHEHKEGTLEESIDESWGGQAFTLPVNYDTDTLRLTAAYSTAQLQAEFGYMFSHFTDNNVAIALPFPASGTSAPFAMTGLYSTPPSNDAQYATAMVGYNLPWQSRININARYGLEMQDDTYPANTLDPYLPVSGFGGLSNLNSSFQGTRSTSPGIMAQVVQGGVALTSAPIHNFSARLYYNIDERDVSMNQCNVSGNKACAVWGGGPQPDASANTATYVVPQEWLKQKIGGQITYHLWPEHNTNLTAGYSFYDISRSNAQVGSSQTSDVTVGLSSMMTSVLMGRITYDYIDRSGVLNYWAPWGALEGGTGADAAPSGAYYQAPMTSNGVTLRTDYSPGGAFSGGLQFKAVNEDFHYPGTVGGPVLTPVNLVNQVEGIKSDYNLTVGIDGNYRPVEGVNLHAYYNYEQIFYNNLGNGACANSNGTATCPTSAGYFQNKQTTDVNTVGVSGDWQATDKLKLGLNYTFSYGSVMFGQFNGVFVPLNGVGQTYQNVANYPDNKSIMNALTVKASYQLTPNMEFSVAGTYAMFLDHNWQDNACTPMLSNGLCAGPAKTTISILTPGYVSPNYNVGAVMASLKVKW